MLSYQDYEKAVYDALMAKRKTDRRFNFSVRQKASKGAERDLFIGTANSLYFGTTFWQINVGYPGSAGDLINLFFFYLDEDKLGYYFQFTQTTTPHNSQNSSALELIKSIESEIKNKIGLITESKAGQKIFMFKTKSRKQAYLTVEEMMKDVFEDAEIIMPIVNKQIEKIKKVNPKFIAHQFTDQEFDKFQEKLKRRLGSKIEISTSESNEHKIQEFKMKSSTDCPLNQILFGPPGTGKTYNTVNEALKIIGGEEVEDLDWNDRVAVKQLFDKKLAEGQIVFTTFHQSMSYEDFIEGIKPIEANTSENESDELTYKVVPGIFKRMVDDIKAEESAQNDLYIPDKYFQDNLVKISLGNSNLPEDEEIYRYCINNNRIAIGFGEDVNFKGVTTRAEVKKRLVDNGYKLTGDNDFTISALERFAIWAKKDRLVLVSQGTKKVRAIGIIKGEYFFDPNSPIRYQHFREVEWLHKDIDLSVSTFYDKNLSQQTIYVIDKDLINREVFKKSKNHKGNLKNRVLIIDEINRGNVSQIFGELITLIEEDKRLGRDEALEVMLPYSKEKFGVPANLYLIGTMNTADRSVEALDTALRRRFSFTEMPPKYELDGLNYSFAGITGNELLRTINKRIEKLLDRDHLIGHSYFLMKDEDKTEPGEKLRNSFYRNIIPLLQEYFFGDYAKIGAVLGRGFVRSINGEENEDSIFSPFEGFEPSDYQDKISYQLIVYQDLNAKQTIQIKDNSEEVDFKRAIEILMNR